LSDIFDKKLWIAETLLIDDKLSEDESGLSVTMCSDDWVEGDTGVGLAWRRGVHWLTARLWARWTLVCCWSGADKGIAKQNTSDEHKQWLSSTRPTCLGICCVRSHLSMSTYHLPSSFPHSFTRGLKPTYYTNPSHLWLPLSHRTAFMD